MSKKNYLDANHLLVELIKSKEQDELTPKAIEYFFLMAQKISESLSYKYEEDRNDCIMFAMEIIVRYWRNFNTSGKQESDAKYAFSYFTTVIFNGLARGWGQLHPIKDSRKVSLSNENIFNFD